MAGVSRYIQWTQQGVGAFFEYDTPKIVHIRSKKIGILSRSVQACVIAYVVGYVMVYNKGYQDTDKVVSAVTAKVKGNLLTDFTDEELEDVRPEWRSLYSRVWDETDFVVPPVENNAFFVMTNLVITPNQTRSECPEVGTWNCTEDFNCTKGATSSSSHGVLTGICNVTTKTCQVAAWCPVEENTTPLKNKAILQGSESFTVLIKNHIYFPKFDKQRSNILSSQNETYLSTCTHDEEHPFCPIFKLGYIVEAAGQNYSDIAFKGGVINIDIKWNCDLDHDFLSHCRPNYQFSRLDDPDAKIAKGWNFRYANYFNENKRTLFKAYGINFVVNVHGEARKFSLIPTLLNLGAGLALLSVATIICDIVVLYCHKNREYYQDKKYLNVDGEDAFKGFKNFTNENPAYTQDSEITD